MYEDNEWEKSMHNYKLCKPCNIARNDGFDLKVLNLHEIPVPVVL